jgi:selenide,water dikinase
LDSLLSRLPRPADANVLVGFETSDAAAVYRLSDDTALVQTVDILTPVADDPFTYGRIAAAKSLSDVYAMGGVPSPRLAFSSIPHLEIFRFSKKSFEADSPLWLRPFAR